MGYFDTLKNLEGIRQRETQNALARQAGGMLAQGDQTGARNALWQGGELDAGFKIEEGMASSRKAKAEAMERWTQGLGRMLQDPRYQGNPDAAWGDAVAFAGQLGIDPEALNRDKAAFDRNPEGWAQFWNGKAKEEQFTLGPGAARYDASGNVIASQPFAPQYRTVGEGQSLVEIPGAGGGNGNPIPGGTPGFNPSAAIAKMEAGGARVTSTTRTPERNRAVGGVPTSRHMSGEAVDLTPGPGQTMAQLAQEARRNFPNARVINEGDHVHVQWGQGGAQAQGGARVVAQGAPKSAASQSPPSGFRWKADGSLEPIPGGPADTISQGGKVTEGERTAGFLASRLADSLKNLTTISAQSPAADKPGILEVGADVVTGGRATNMVRSGERQQVVANQLDVLDAALTLGTGAAYTREQLLNYRETYFPALTDKPATVQAKRQKLIALLNAAKIKAGRSAPPELDQALEAARRQWAPQGAQRPAAKPAAAQPAKANATQRRLSPEEAAKLKPGTRFIGQDGVERVRR